jgi:hypothetical protein
MMGLSALAGARPDVLAKLLAPLFRQLVEGAPRAVTPPSRSR